MSRQVETVAPMCFQAGSSLSEVEAEKPALLPRSKLAGGTDQLLATMVALVHDTVFLYRLLRHPKTPWYARGLLCLPVMYLCSPIQLMPNFIPVLGQMDDVCVIWMAKKFVRRLVDVKTRQECHDAAAAIKFPPLVQRLAHNYKSIGGSTGDK